MVMINRKARERQYHDQKLDTFTELLSQYRPKWMEQAACRWADPAAFFGDEVNNGRPPGNTWMHQAQAVCATCPVFDECDRYADEQEIADGGVWAGKIRRTEGHSAIHKPAGTLYERRYGGIE